MSSPAHRHYQRVTAAEASAKAAANEQPVMVGNAYELMLAQLDTDRRRLKSIQSVDRKIETKRELLPAYGAYVAGVLDAGRGVQDDVLMTVLVWRIDVGDLHGAIAIARHALAHKLLLPDQYQRSLGCLLAEEFADGALKVLKSGGTVDIPALETIAELTADEDMPDEVRAKLLKAIGLGLESTAPALAQDYLQQALAKHDGVGVKKDLERIARTIKNSAGSESTG